MDKTTIPDEMQDNNIVLSESDEQKFIEELRALIKGSSYIIFFKKLIILSALTRGSYRSHDPDFKK